MRTLYTTNKKNCKDYERPWRDGCVDIGLEDEWLEALNSLALFNLISICWGHPKRRGVADTQPHINLRFKYDARLPLPIDKIQFSVSRLKSALKKRYPADKFDTSMSLDFKINSRTGSEVLSDVTIRIVGEGDLLHEVESEKRDWFNLAVKNTQEFDRDWKQIIHDIYESEIDVNI